MYPQSRVVFTQSFRSITIKLRIRNNMSSQAVPVIMCGRTEQIGKPAIEILKPEYEVIYFIPTDEDGVTNIPRLLQGQEPSNPVSHAGSGNYTNVPVAIIVGGGYKDENIEKFKHALANTPEARKVPFLKADNAKTEKLGVTLGGPGYADHIAQRAKDMLTQLKEEGKLDGRDGGDYYF